MKAKVILINLDSQEQCMAIIAAMTGGDGKDELEHDLVMPGFRFHPTEEELIDFYLRRKVEGKHFNIELITFLDLYHYDPWELPALAAIGEKEWYFYVPRDRKYRNGDRPNRVTTSGYWKATGADRTLQGESSRSIGLKKTLVFYSGKAPKGIRTSWIMNEYRLPHCETNLHHKAETSLCRVYKRSGVEDRLRLPAALSTRPSSSSPDMEGCSSNHNLSTPITHKPFVYDVAETEIAPLSSIAMLEDGVQILLNSKSTSVLPPSCTLLPFATLSPMVAAVAFDDINRIMGYSQFNLSNQQTQSAVPSSSQPRLLAGLDALPNSFPNIAN